MKNPGLPCYTVGMTDTIKLEDYYTVKQAADALGVGPQWIRDLIREKRLRAIKLSGNWLVLRVDVENFERQKTGRKPKKN